MSGVEVGIPGGRNGLQTSLSVGGSRSSVAYAITVKDGTVYTAGKYTMAKGGDVLCLWVGSARTDLTDAAQGVTINAAVLR